MLPASSTASWVIRLALHSERQYFSVCLLSFRDKKSRGWERAAKSSLTSVDRCQTRDTHSPSNNTDNRCTNNRVRGGYRVLLGFNLRTKRRKFLRLYISRGGGKHVQLVANKTYTYVFGLLNPKRRIRRFRSSKVINSKWYRNSLSMCVL